MGYNPWGCKEANTTEHVRRVKQSRGERKEETEVGKDRGRREH